MASKEKQADVVQALLLTAKVYGYRRFQAILAATSPKTLEKLLATLISSLPPALQAEFIAMTSEFSFPVASV